MKRLAITVTLLLVLPATSAAANTPDAGFGRATLTGFASLPAQTFVPASEPSGSLLGTAPINGVTPPFEDQPVQGFSGIARNRSAHDGSFDVLSDNGYGNKANSADFVLRIHRVIPDFRAKTVDVVGGLNLTDPRGLVPWPLTRADRVLTGADFDVESIVKTDGPAGARGGHADREPTAIRGGDRSETPAAISDDGGYWIGDEFGPYLLRFDRAGRLAAAPIPLPGVYAPERAAMLGVPANLGGSKGFEGMAESVDGRFLYPLLEGTVTGDPAGSLRINEFDRRSQAYTGTRWIYQMESAGNAIGDFISIDRHRFLVIERDSLQGDAAAFKRIYQIDLRDRDRDGNVDKTLVADLLDIADPKHLFGPADTFRFPFQTIEDVVILDDRTLGVLNDNNFPFSAGRTPGLPDNNEFITIRLTRSLR